MASLRDGFNWEAVLLVLCGVCYKVSLILKLDSVELSRLLWLHRYHYCFMVTVIKTVFLQQDGAWVPRVKLS